MLNITQTAKEKILDVLQAVKRNISILTKLLPIISFITPFLILYSLYPSSFEATWKGRTYYLFFLWLVSLEIMFSWEKLQINKVDKLGSIRTVAFITALLLPTIYVVVANYCGLNAIIADLVKQNNIPWVDWILISTEYLVFAVLFCLIILLAYGINGLMDFSISAFFLGSIGVIYTIDNLCPYGRFTPFQILVPTTTALAASVLNLMGYQTRTSVITSPTYGSMPRLTAWDPKNPSKLGSFGIAWPCAGVESLVIYTITILLFLKKSAIPWKHKIAYFVIGAMVTYSINVLRIVTIFLIAISCGNNSPEVWLFHDYYGQLYSITWIISYPIIIIGSRALWSKIRKGRQTTTYDLMPGTCA